MSDYDRRRRVLESALFSPDLSYAEKVFMVVVVTIKAEYVEGKPRYGSRPMGPDGRFAHHLDYLARALSKSPNGVRKLRQQLERTGFLVPVHDGTFGRPPTWQAQTVRGAENGRVTGGGNRTPYGLGEWLPRVAETAPLTYRTPDLGDQSPAARGSGTTEQQALGSDEQAEDTGADSRLTACERHGWATCQDVACIDTETTRKRTA